MNYLHHLLHKQIEDVFGDMGEFAGVGGQNHLFVPEIILQIED